MQFFKETLIYLALMFILLPCLNVHSEPVNREEHIPASVYIERGKAKLSAGDYAGAIADFERVIAIKSDHALAYSARGRAKQALGQHTAAEADFQKARALNPDVEKLYPFSNGGIE